MRSFVWNDCFVTGIVDVDDQHHKLVDLINLFGEHLAENEIEFDEVETVLRELTHYAYHHFTDEEKMMWEIGIDRRHLDVHVDQHHSFLRDVTLMREGIGPDNPEGAHQLLAFLIHWLAFHILGSDQNMARQAELIRSGVSPAEAFDAEERASDDSTEPLVVALKGLFQQISARNRELVELNQSLEAKVAERTRELSEANTYLEQLALTDVLTGIPNRRHAMRRLADLWEEARAAETPLSCIMIDADAFKDVNDSFGHDAGDRVLVDLARTLVHTVRSDDVVCRLGGDEFLVICPNTGQEGALLVAETIWNSVNALNVPVGSGRWEGRISVGFAVGTSDMSHHEDLIRAADQAVYAAKREGRNCIRSA